MDKRPDNVFQFLEVERKPPAKIGLVTRKTAFREIYEPVTEANLRDQAHRCLACGNPYCQWRCPVHNLKDMLRTAGLRPTRQRVALGWILFGKGDRHVTAESLFEEA